MKIGFVGLGIMGHPMALNLIKGGHELFVYGKRRMPADVRAAGATVCDTLKAIAEQSEIVIVMVPDTPASGAIYIYDRVGQQFYLVSFDQGSDDTLTIREFEDLLGEYRLLDCVSNPSLFRGSVQERARA